MKPTPETIDAELMALAKEADALAPPDTATAPDHDAEMAEAFAILRDLIPPRFPDEALQATIEDAMGRWGVTDPAKFVALVKGPKAVDFRAILADHMGGK